MSTFVKLQSACGKTSTDCDIFDLEANPHGCICCDECKRIIAEKEADLNRCQMCGHKSQKLQNRWYQYDNGQRFIASICTNCAELHDKLSDQKVRSV